MPVHSFQISKKKKKKKRKAAEKETAPTSLEQAPPTKKPKKTHREMDGQPTATVSIEMGTVQQPLWVHSPGPCPCPCDNAHVRVHSFQTSKKSKSKSHRRESTGKETSTEPEMPQNIVSILILLHFSTWWTMSTCLLSIIVFLFCPTDHCNAEGVCEVQQANQHLCERGSQADGEAVAEGTWH